MRIGACERNHSGPARTIMQCAAIAPRQPMGGQGVDQVDDAVGRQDVRRHDARITDEGTVAGHARR